MTISSTRHSVGRTAGRRRRRVLAALAATAVVLTGCGSGGDDDATTGELTPEQREQLDNMEPLDLDDPPTTSDTADIPAREVDSILPTGTQLAQDYPDPVSLLEEYLEISSAALVEGDEIVLSASVSTEYKHTLEPPSAERIARTQYLTDRPVDAEADRLAAAIGDPWQLDEDSTRTLDDGTARELVYSADGSSPNYPDLLRVVVAPDEEMAGTVVQIVEQVYSVADARPEAPVALVGYEKEFGFEAPASCISTKLSLDLTTYNPQVPLFPSIAATWSCPGIDVAAVQAAVTTAMESDTRFSAEPWEPIGDDQIARFRHGEADGQWSVAPPDPPFSPGPFLALNLRAPSI